MAAVVFERLRLIAHCLKLATVNASAWFRSLRYGAPE